MTRLVLVRHGQTAWNLEGRAQGHTDIGLDDTGRAQAVALAPYIAEMAPAALWSSDLTRARETAAHLAAATGQDRDLDPEVVQHVAAWFEGREEMYRSAGAVGPRTVAADDPQSRLLAAFGRDPSW